MFSDFSVAVMQIMQTIFSIKLEKMHPVLDRESQSPIDSQTFSLLLSPHFLVQFSIFKTEAIFCQPCKNAAKRK